MFRIDVASAAASRPTPKTPGTPGYFTNGSALGGIPATIVDQDWLNGVQEELISILTAAGVTPTKTSVNQVLTSLQALFGTANRSVSGTTDTILATDLLTGIYYTNSGAVTVTLPNNLPVGFKCFPRLMGTGSITFSAASGASLVSGYGVSGISTRYKKVWLEVVANSGGSSAEWAADG